MSKISELSDGGVIQGGDTLIAVRSGGNVKVTYGGTTTANIDGGTIDNTTIGGTTTAAGSFTTLQADTSLNVDGTVTADGLTISSASANVADLRRANNTGAGQVLLGNSDGYVRLSGTNGSFDVFNAGNTAQRFGIANNGDVSLYEDTGTTAKLFWDASAEALAVGGTNTFTSKIVASAANGTAYSSNAQLRISGGGTNNNRASILFSDDALSDGKISYYPHATEASRLLSLSARTTESDFVLTGSGNVGIGTSSVDTTLHLSAGNIGPVLRLECTDTAHVTDQAVGVIEFEHNDASGVPGVPVKIGAYAENNHGSMGLRFYTGVGNTANEVVRFDHDGNIGIGTTSPQRQLHVSKTANNTHIAIERDGTDNPSALILGANQNKTEIISSAAEESTSGVPLTFLTGNTERMRIDSSGNVLFGRSTSTNPASDTAGNGGAMAWWENNNDGFLAVSRNNSSSDAIVAGFNRTNGDGKIVGFNKDGSQVGSIGTHSGGGTYFYSNSGSDSGLTFWSNVIAPSTSAGAYRDAAIDLGASGGRFKDLYLSGGAYLGGVASANQLDDYEEGTWTPALWQGTHTYTSQVGRYVKIGKMVTVWGAMNISSRGSSSSELGISGLPFASSGGASAYASVLGIHSAYGSSPLLPTGVDPTGVSVESTSGYFRSTHSTNASYNINQLNSSGEVTFAFTYEAT